MSLDHRRFLDAQATSYADALGELRAGRKTSHWIWWIFPQLAGLGFSERSRTYGLRTLDEARAYLDHPVLGARLRECAEALLGVEGRTAEDILGRVDALKVRSSMTLFHRADPGEPLWREVLDRCYGGVPDARTDELLAGS